MAGQNQQQDSPQKSQENNKSFWELILIGSFVILTAIAIDEFGLLPTNRDPRFSDNLPPLAMSGGDPYIRALMRAISASESNLPYPYWLLYGGGYVRDLSEHPDICITIVSGPNLGDCTTAAGRYQFLSSTWERMAERYHPRNFALWNSYSFEPEYQDAVVYAWLSDPQAWNMSISQMLQQGRIHEVLQRLSGTWTSLGYGIETNDISPYLPAIYQELLEEELAAIGVN